MLVKNEKVHIVIELSSLKVPKTYWPLLRTNKKKNKERQCQRKEQKV
jgi:hypothetical protein